MRVPSNLRVTTSMKVALATSPCRRRFQLRRKKSPRDREIATRAGV
jgi:hypothetical protein